MGVWSVQEREAEAIGSKMAAHRAVSQCYLRPTYEDWPYNLYTIVHGRSVDECESVLNELAEETGITQRRALFPMKEFKKSRISFFPRDRRWEAVRVSASPKRRLLNPGGNGNQKPETRNQKKDKKPEPLLSASGFPFLVSSFGLLVYCEMPRTT